MKRSGAIALLVLGFLACDRQAAPDPPVPPPAAKASAPIPWTWHPLGGLAVVEGEVAEPTELVLEGRSIREARFAEPGPVRWEFFRPPAGEAAVLRTQAGQTLARFEFTTTPNQGAVPRAPKAPAPPRAARTVPPAAPAEPVQPRVRTGTRPQDASVAALASKTRTSLATAPRPVPPPEPGAPRPPAPVAALQAPAAPLSQVPPSWPGMGEALNLTRGPGGHRRLLLSFDGGSNAEVAAEVLDTLKARNVRTTLFLTGAFIQRYPALVKRMAAEGHELGNHTMNHPHFAPDMKRDPKWTRERVQRELLEADAALVSLLGRPMDPFWRAPYGEHTAEIRRWAEEVGYRHVGWSEGADTLDWATPKERRLYRSGDAILRRLQSRLDRDGDGLIVLMHLGSERAEGDRPSAGLGAFMDRARMAGWAFVPVSAYLRDLGKPAWDPQHRLALLQASGSAPLAR